MVILKAVKYLQRKAKRYRWIKQLNTKTKHFLVIFQKYFKRFRRYIEQDVYSNSCRLALKRELNKKVSTLTIKRSYQ